MWCPFVHSMIFLLITIKNAGRLRAMNDYNNKLFMCKTTDTTTFFHSGTIFTFKQYGRLIHATFKAENIKYGELIGLTRNGLIEYSLNIQLQNQEVYGGIGTIQPCRTTGPILQGYYSITNAYESFDCSFILEKVSLQNQIPWRRRSC